MDHSSELKAAREILKAEAQKHVFRFSAAYLSTERLLATSKAWEMAGDMEAARLYRLGAEQGAGVVEAERAKAKKIIGLLQATPPDKTLLEQIAGAVAALVGSRK